MKGFRILRTWPAIVLAMAAVSCSDEQAITEPGYSPQLATVANLAPTADPGGPYYGFIKVNIKFDGRKSTDDGPTADLSYLWNFGDGRTGTGATPSHAYEKTGTYTVTLTVKDKGGLSSAPVSTTVLVDPPNKAPIAIFGGAPYRGYVGVPLQLDASPSYDPDNHEPMSYKWTFGDGIVVTTSDSMPMHTYLKAGTFTIRLKVTDKYLKTSTEVKTTVQITVAPPPGVLILDNFKRTVTGGFGKPNFGSPWRVDPEEFASQFRVDGTRGIFTVKDTLARKVVSGGKILPIDTASYGLNVEGLMQFSLSALPDSSGKSFSIQVYARRNDRLGDGNNHYRYRLQVFGRGTVKASISKQVNGSGDQWLKLPNGEQDALVPGFTLSTPFLANTKYLLRWEAVGTTTTTVRMRMWRDGTIEPTDWHYSHTGSEPALDNSGTSGIRFWTPNRRVFPTGGIQLSIYNFQYSLKN